MGSLHLIDIVVILGLMLVVTWLGDKLSGRITDRESFFQAAGTLPWWAVSASIIATLVSSVTFISVPAAVFADGGNLTYFQVILGLAAGKILVALILSRAYFESRGIDTTYGYIGARMDPATGTVSMVLGLLLGVINSGVKLLTASLVLDVISGWGLGWCATFVLAFALVWSALAGIRTVIWTDFLLFILFACGAAFALGFMFWQIDQSWQQALVLLDQQAKLVLFDFSTDPAVRYTIWAGVIGGSALNIAQASTQGTWQRVRACRSLADARRAYLYAAAFYVMHLLILGVGLALVVYYAERGVPAELTTQLIDSPDRIFPYFIANELPIGVSGLFIAAIFAAAISTLDSALTETADVSVRHLYEPLRPAQSETHYLLISRVFLGVWSLIFLGVALFFSRYTAEGLLDLTFKLPNYLYGAIMATILLARFGIGRWPQVLVGLIVACVTVALMASAEVAFFWWCPVSGGLMFAVVWLLSRQPINWDPVVHAQRPADRRP